MTQGCVERTGNRAAQRQVGHYGGEHADQQGDCAHRAEHFEAVLRGVVTLLGRYELELAQRVVGGGEIVVRLLQMLGVVDDLGLVVRRYR